MSRSTDQSSPHPAPGHLPPHAREGSATAIPAQLYLRAFAALYDLLPLLGIWFGAGLLALLVTGGALDPHQAAHKFIVQALVLMLTATYFILSWARGGQTIGMRAWRLRVVSADGSPLPGAELDVWQANDQGFYDVQQPDVQPRANGRGLFTAAADGS